MNRLAVAIAIAALLAPSCTSSRGEGARRSFAPTPCPPDVASVILTPVRCGYLTVPEDRPQPTGRMVRLFVAIVSPSSGEAARADPVYVPGVDLGDAQSFIGTAPIAPRVHREAILMDQRGTGHSEPSLDCPEIAQLGPELVGSRTSDPTMRADLASAVAACRDRLTRQGIDVGAYDIEAMAQDAIDLRTALGIDSWNLQSHGTYSRVLLQILGGDEAHVRSVVLDSPQFPETDDLTEAIEGTRYVLGRLVANCRDDSACAPAYPHLAATIRQAERRLHAHPVASTFQTPGAGPVRVLVDAGAFMRALRAMLTDNHSDLAPDVPLAAARAAHGDVSIVAKVLAGTTRPDRELCVGYRPKCGVYDFSLGVYLSSMCRDEVPFVDPSQLAASTSSEVGLEEAFADPPILDECRAWNVPPAPEGIRTAVSSGVPMLIASGEYDAYSPYPLDRSATQDLPNAFLYEVPFFGHNVHSTAAALRIRNEWIDRPTSPPDLAPLDKVRPGTFALPG